MPTPAASETAPDLRVVAQNLLLLIGLGVSISAWILFYTDWFPVIGGLLGLGGLFAWIAFLSNLVPEGTTKRLQSAFERRVLAQPNLRSRLRRPCLLLLLVPLFFGSVRFDGTLDSDERLIGIKPELSGIIGEGFAGWWTPAWSLVPGRGEHKMLRPVGPYRVYTPGLPSRLIWVFPLWRPTYDLPGWFERHPVFFVLPSRNTSISTSNQPMTLQIYVNGKVEYRSSNYRGESFWLGCRADEIILPAWLQELIAERATMDEDLERRLTSPLSNPELQGIQLKQRDRVLVQILNDRQEIHASGAGTVSPLPPSQSWPPRIDIFEEGSGKP